MRRKADNYLLLSISVSVLIELELPCINIKLNSLSFIAPLLFKVFPVLDYLLKVFSVSLRELVARRQHKFK